MLVYQFPGQGSQYKGMGQDLFPEFPELVAQANEILGYSITTLCLDDPLQQLNLTEFTQPAIFTVNALSYLKKLRTASQKPDYVIGHSLGEYNALFAAEVFDFATGLTLVKKRGELMAQETNGSMAAITGIPYSSVEKILNEHNFPDLTIANYNSYQQLVLSGDKNSLMLASSVFSKYPQSNFIPLNVSGAFHSKYMTNAQQSYAEFITPYQFNMPSIPVIANLNAQTYHPRLSKLYLIQQITQPVLWLTTIEYLLQQNKIIFEELGNSKTLTKLADRIKNKQ